MPRSQADDLSRLLVRIINRNQVLILNSVENTEDRITNILNTLSESEDIPLSTLKHNAKQLKKLNILTYGTATNRRNVEITPFGETILELVRDHYGMQDIRFLSDVHDMNTVQKEVTAGG